MKSLTANVGILGNGYFNFYIVGKNNAALLECGTSAGAEIFKQQWLELKEKPNIKYIVVLHSHFDHICGIPVLKQLFPDAELVASQAAKKILAKERIVSDLFANEAIVSENYYAEGLMDKKLPALNVTSISIDKVVGEGDTLKLDDELELKFLDAPGHSVCSIAAYLESDEVMFVSDAAGVRISEELISPVFFQDYDLYIATLKKFKSYQVNTVGVAHGDIPSGAAEDFFNHSLESARKAFNEIKQRLESGHKEELIAQDLFSRYIKGGMALYPRSMMLGSMFLMIKQVKERL